MNQGAGNEWVAHAARLAGVCAEFDASWADIVGKVPRHNFVPRWFEDGDREWRLQDGPSDPQQWMDAAYSPRSLVTRVGGLHADLCSGPTAVGGPTSAITDAREVVVMLRSGEINSDSQVLCVAGSGYAAAAIDIDPYLVSSATEHLASIGLAPVVQEYSITGDLPGEFDRIISTVSVRPIPPSWLSALRPGGRLVTSIAGTSLLVTANKTEDGGAAGMIEHVDAAFMAARGGEDEPDEALNALFEQVRDQDGEQVTTSRFPVPVGPLPWELRSVLEPSALGQVIILARRMVIRRCGWLTLAAPVPACPGRRMPPYKFTRVDREGSAPNLRRSWVGGGVVPASSCTGRA